MLPWGTIRNALNQQLFVQLEMQVLLQNVAPAIRLRVDQLPRRKQPARRPSTQIGFSEANASTFVVGTVGR